MFYLRILIKLFQILILKTKKNKANEFLLLL